MKGLLKKSNHGFTLIEVMITLSILSVLTVLTAQSLRQAVTAKEKIQKQIDAISPVRDVQKLIQKDIQMAFHYRDIEKEMAELFQKTKKEVEAARKKQNPNYKAPPPPDNNPNGIPGEFDESSASRYPSFFKTEFREDPETHFIGKESEMHFVTSNVYRTMKDSPQADFAEVSYFIDSCHHNTKKDFNSGKCLYRRWSPIVDKDVSKGGKRTQLLNDISDFQLRYFSRPKKDWVKDWSSDAKGDASTRGQFPEAVEVTLKIESKSNSKQSTSKKITIQMLVPIHNPNNPTEDSQGQQNGQP